MTGKFAKIGFAAAITLGALGFAAGPAAAAVNGTCASGEFCLYENNDFNRGNTNNVYQWTGNDSDYNNNRWYNATAGDFTNDVLDNEASSVRNRMTCRVVLYQHVGYGGANSSFAPGAEDGYLANNSIGDNRASAHARRC
ncbi:hypothetical protein SUDANB121_00982 [Nocardiopsis dassonvillei]|uniref:peptidase inhibitor family I36 protein n=1 Tax=Nocardiopsis dassonvillei TaxID=2014 RepID=UPI003F57EDE1